MKLVEAYKKKRYATGGGMNDAVDGVTATEKPGLMQGFGLAASLGSGIIDATAKPDPISGRVSTGATVGKGALTGAATGAQFGPLGALAGGVIGGGLGLLKGLKEKKEARQMVAEDARNKYQDDASRSNALLATNPELLTGYKNSGYYAMGGAMGEGGGDPNDPKPPATRKLTPAEMAQWNQFLDHVKSKGYEGSADLNVKNKNLGASLFADWKKANPNATINYDIVPSVQQEMQNLKTNAQGFAQRRGDPNAPNIMAGVSPVDGWFGSKTSQFRFPGMTTMTTQNGVVTDNRNLGLVNANITPVGINADGTANDGKTQVGQTVAQMMNLPKTMAWKPGLNDIYGKPVPKDAKIELTADGKYFYDNPQEGLREVKFGSGGTIHIKPENRGKFNATKARTGKTTEELTHSSNPVTRKRAIFAQNAAKWHHANGGPLDPPIKQAMSDATFVKRPINTREPITPQMKAAQLKEAAELNRLRDKNSAVAFPDNDTVWEGDSVRYFPGQGSRLGVPYVRDGLGVKGIASGMNASDFLGKGRQYVDSTTYKVNFANGGKAPLAMMYMSGGYAKSLSSDNTELVGNSHANGGIDVGNTGIELEGNETTAGNFVFSDKLGFADMHKKIAAAKGKIEKKPATFERVNSMKRLAGQEQNLALLQEYYKRQHGIA